MKITETWKKLPEHEQRNLLKREEKRHLIELREVKLNIWKKWRNEPEEKKKETQSKHSTNHEKWLARIEETLARMNREVEEEES